MIEYEDIIAPIPPEELMQELTQDKFLRISNHGGKEIYVVDANNAPNVVQEIGRLREITFRAAGGGTGKSIDLDEFDTGENPFKQLIVWNPQAKEIIGGYRYMRGSQMQMLNGIPQSPMSHLFTYSTEFIKEYIPYTIELGRSFVAPNYQPSINPREGIFALDNIWDGLGAITKRNPDIKYFFGKMTMYNSYNRQARDLILFFLQKYFPDPDNLMTPIDMQNILGNPNEIAKLFTGGNLSEDFRILNRQVRALGVNIPPLINIYMGLSDKMRCFGTTPNIDFGPVEETGIMLAIKDIFPAKAKRHMS